MSRETAWILRRTSVASERLPRFGEGLELRTRCTGMAKSVAERTTTIAGDAGASLETVAIWVHLDAELRRPARLPQEFLAAYEESAAGNRPRSSLRHPAEPPADAEESGWRFARADVDYAGHVNNTMYWRVAEELLGVERFADAPAAFEAEYRAGLGAGAARVHRLGGSLWVCDEEGVVAATITVGEPGTA